MTTVFMESGTDATQDLTFYASTSGTVASDSGQAYTGPRSLKCTTVSGTAGFVTAPVGSAADAGTRISFYFRFDSTPSAGDQFFVTRNSGTATGFRIRWNAGSVISLKSSAGVQLAAGTTALSTNTWYRISIAYTITSTTVYSVSVWINGVLEMSVVNGAALFAIGTNQFSLSAEGTGNRNTWFDNIYADNSAAVTDTGNVLVTAKRPIANGTTNGFTTQIGSGGSGYGTGHAPQVNEQPLNTANGWSVAAAGSAVTEEYNVEGRAIGDVDIASGVSIVDLCGWAYAKALVSETGQLVLNGATPSVTIPTSNTMLTAFAGATNYPAGAGTDIGLVTSTTVTTVSLFECGILVAYIPIAAAFPVFDHHYRMQRAA